MQQIEFEKKIGRLTGSAVVEGVSAKESPLPLPLLKDVSHFGFDIEDTVVHHGSFNFALKITQVLRYIQHQKSGKLANFNPREYLEVAPDIDSITERKVIFKEERDEEAKKGIWTGHISEWERYRADVRSFASDYKHPPTALEYASQKANSTVPRERLFNWGVSRFIRSLEGDDARNEVVEKVFGIKPEDFWAAYGEFAKLIASNPVEYAQVNKQVANVGVVEFLNALSESGRKIHFITNASLQRVEPYLEILRRAGFVGEVSSIVSAGDIGHKKPEPEGILEVLKDNNLTRSLEGKYPFAYIGNAETDVRAAANADCSFPMLYNPNRLDFSQFDLPPYHMFRSFKGLSRVLKDEKVLY